MGGGDDAEEEAILHPVVVDVVLVVLVVLVVALGPERGRKGLFVAIKEWRRDDAKGERGQRHPNLVCEEANAALVSWPGRHGHGRPRARVTKRKVMNDAGETNVERLARRKRED